MELIIFHSYGRVHKNCKISFLSRIDRHSNQYREVPFTISDILLDKEQEETDNVA